MSGLMMMSLAAKLEDVNAFATGCENWIQTELRFVMRLDYDQKRILLALYKEQGGATEAFVDGVADAVLAYGKAPAG